MVSYEDLTDEQQYAVDALDRNVTLTAGAGTGKTTTLTARYLRMIEDSLAGPTPEGDTVPLLPKNILTTTFTERAANELEDSIRTEITERIESLAVDDFDAWRTIADELEHGYIHTLHGFCTRLLREHALTIDAIDPEFDTLDEDETTTLIHDTVGAVLEEHETHPTVEILARRFSRQQLQDVLTDLLTERPESLEWADQWADGTDDEYLSFVQSTLHPIDPKVAAHRLSDPDFVEAVETLAEIIEDPPAIDTGGKAWTRAERVVDLLGVGFDDGTPSTTKQTLIAELGQHLTTSSGERYAGYTGAKTRWNNHDRKEVFDDAFEILVETLQPEDFAVNVDLEIEANSFQFVQALAELTQIAAEEYAERKDRQNVVDFTDQIALAVSFLEKDDNADVRARLRDQFEYVMVDEFQDTDPRQWDLIKLLTASDGTTFDAQNVFVVGDVKQSIYRFRNADVTQFQETADTLEAVSAAAKTGEENPPDDDDQLSTNFRTLPTVLECINELFDATFEEAGEPYEAPPQPLTPNREDPAGLGSTEYLAVPTDADLRRERFDEYEDFAEAEPEHSTKLEAMALAARLSQVLSKPVNVYSEVDTESDGPPSPRPIDPSDIAILIRSRTHLKKYERALSDVEIPYSVASGVGFYESAEITALLNLFRALADPSDGRALYAALRSPLFGYTDDTLARLTDGDGDLWETLAASEQDPLQATYSSLCEWRAMAGLSSGGTDGHDGSWSEFLTHLLEETGYLVSVGADERPEQAVANVQKFREQLRGWSDDGIRSLPSLVNRIERRIELGGRESEAPTTEEGVQILTIHDAKGMEFPFVVVPGISRGFNNKAAIGGGQVEFEQINGQPAIGMKAPSLDDPFEMTDTIARETIRDRRRAEEIAEEKRCLYVACTRARDHLLLSGLHDSAGEAPEPTVTDFEAPDPESPSSWRDWVQPEFLTESVCDELETNTRVQRAYGDGKYAVSLPTPPVHRQPTSPDTDPTVELTPAPDPSPVTFKLSATQLASVYGGYSELRFNEDTRTIYAEEIDEASDDKAPDSRHGESEPEMRYEDEEGDKTESAAARGNEDDDAGERVDATVFGEMVHRICELQPPEERWSDLMEQTLHAEDASGDLTPELRDRVCKHAKRGIEYVKDQAAGSDDQYQYDELYVTAEFERGEISGFIDHLIVTPDEYHIIDYKTGDVTAAEMEDDARYYKNQMKAYAMALQQQQTGRDIRVSLIFTALDEAWTVTWPADEVASIVDEITAQVGPAFDELE